MNRSLPIRMDPLPGEAIDSWLAAIAQRMHCTWAEVLAALVPRATGAAEGHDGHHALWGVLSDREAAALTAATGVAPENLNAMTLVGRFGDRIISAAEESERVGTPWWQVRRQRFCPACLRATNGRFRLEWRLPWATVCAEHGCFLVDICPECGLQQDVWPHWFLSGVIPGVGRCRHGPFARLEDQCQALLAAAPSDRLSSQNPVMLAQQQLSRVLALGVCAEGAYSTSPVTAVQLLKDLFRLANWIYRNSTLETMASTVLRGQGARAINQWRSRLGPELPGRAKYELGNASSAAAVALGLTVALHILTQPTIQCAADRLRALAPDHQPRTQYQPSGRSEILIAIEISSRADTFRELDEFRYRSFTSLPRPPNVRRTAGVHPLSSAVPTLLWPRCAARLNTGDVQWNHLREVLSYLLLTIGSASPTRLLNQQLRSRLEQHRVIVAVGRMRGFPHWLGIRHGLLRLHDYLADNRPPIDYQRRRALHYDALLTPPHWDSITGEYNITHIPIDIARTGLIERISGSLATQVAGGVTKRPLETELDDLRVGLTTKLRQRLDIVAHDFLVTQDVTDEPVVWEPPAAILDGLGLANGSPTYIGRDELRHAVDQRIAVFAIAKRFALPLWQVRYQLEHDIRRGKGRSATRVPWTKKRRKSILRQAIENALPESTLRELYETQRLTVVQVGQYVVPEANPHALFYIVRSLLATYGIPTRYHRRPDISGEWVYREHVCKGRALKALAAEMHSTVGTLRRRLHVCGFEPEALVERVLRALSLDPEIYPTAARRRFAWHAMTRFVIVSGSRSFVEAAPTLGCSSGSVASQVRRLEARLGHALLDRRAKPGRALTLTTFGEELVEAIVNIDRTAAA